MNFEELEKLVIKKAPLPMSGRYEETVCFLALRGLYTSLAGTRITQEQAVKDRVQLKKDFYHMCWLHDRYAAALAQSQEFLRLAGRDRPEILGALKRHAEPAEAMRLMADCIASLCQDKVFAQRAVKLLEKEYNDKGKK